MSVASVQVPVAFPVYLCGGAGRRRGGVRRIQLSMCKHSSWEPRQKWLFFCPLFLTRNRPLENIGRALMALLWPRECFVYAYWQNISVLWHVYTGTRVNWKRNASVRVWGESSHPFHAKCSLESSLDTSSKKQHFTLRAGVHGSPALLFNNKLHCRMHVRALNKLDLTWT